MNIEWRKSSRSGTGGDGGQSCVELADLGKTVGIRDSKNPTGPHLSVSPAALGGLAVLIKAGLYDRW